MSSIKLDRPTLAKFLPDTQSIMAFEKIFKSVEQALPDGIEAATSLAYAATALANLAVSMLAQHAEQLDQLAYAPVTPPIEPSDQYFPAVPTGTLGQQNSDSVEITGGSIDGTTIGVSVASSGAFTTLTATGAVALSPANANVVLSPTGTGLVTISPATLGSMDKVAIGGTTPAAAAVTTLTASGAVTLNPANAAVSFAPTGTGVVTIAPAALGTMDNMTIGATTRAVGNFTTLNTNGNITLTKATGVPKITVTATTGTNETYLQFINTGGGYYFGVENSASDWFGATAYAAVVLAPAGKVIQQMVGGTISTTTSGTGFKVAGGFGCNGKGEQGVYASGGAMDTTAATNIAPFGFATAAQTDSIATKLNAIQAALIANGIMS